MYDSAIDILINATDKASPAVKSAQTSLDALGKSAKEGSGALGSFQQTGNQLWSILGSVATVAIAGAAAGLAGLGVVLGESVGQAREQIAAQKQLSAVLTSTGGAAGVTSDQAKKLSDSLSRATNFTDDAVLSGENMLLTFTNIGSNVFPRATQTALDMSQALGQDMKSSAIQLGKALNDPITGVSALQRVGVTFNDTQKETIKTMVEAGNVAGAQGLILDELAKEFGGSAKAMADPAIQLKNAWGELEEQVGMFVIPVLNNLAKQAMPYLQATTDLLSKAVENFNGYLSDGYPLLTALRMSIGELIPSNFADIWDGLIDTISNAIRIFQSLFMEVKHYEDDSKLVEYLIYMGDMARGTFTYFYDQAKRVITLLWDWSQRVMVPLIIQMEKFFYNVGQIWDGLVKVIKPVGDAIAKFMGFDDVMTALGILLAGPAIAAIYGLIAGFVAFLAPIAEVVAAVAVLRWAWQSNFANIRTSTEETLAKLSKWFYDDSGLWKGTWEKTFRNMYDIVYEFFRYKIYNEVMRYFEHTEHAVVTWAENTLNTWKGWTQHVHDVLSGWVKDGIALFTNWKDRVISTFHEWIDPLQKDLDNWIIGTKQQLAHWVGWWVGDLGLLTKWKKDVIALFQPVLDWWHDHVDPWIQYGKDVIQGLWDGMQHTWHRLVDWFTGTWDGLVHDFKEFFGIKSPSTLFAGYGQNMMEGLGEGIQAYSHIPIDYMDSMSNSLTAQMERIKSAVVQNVFDINNAAKLLNINPANLPASMGGTGQVIGYGPNGELILAGAGNALPGSHTTPPAATPPAATLGSSIGGGLGVSGSTAALLGGINLGTPDIKSATDSAASAAQKVKDFIAGIGDFLAQTVNTHTLTQVFRGAGSSAVGAPGEGYVALQKAQDGIRTAMASLLGLSTINGTLDAAGNLQALTKTISAGTDLGKVSGLLQSAVNFRTLANYYDPQAQYGSALPTDKRLTGTSDNTTNNYNITLQGSNNANADVLGLVQLLGSLQGAATP